jgi:hypothetical protein
LSDWVSALGKIRIISGDAYSSCAAINTSSYPYCLGEYNVLLSGINSTGVMVGYLTDASGGGEFGSFVGQSKRISFNG